MRQGLPRALMSGALLALVLTSTVWMTEPVSWWMPGLSGRRMSVLTRAHSAVITPYVEPQVPRLEVHAMIENALSDVLGVGIARRDFVAYCALLYNTLLHAHHRGVLDDEVKEWQDSLPWWDPIKCIPASWIVEWIMSHMAAPIEPMLHGDDVREDSIFYQAEEVKEWYGKYEGLAHDVHVPFGREATTEAVGEELIKGLTYIHIATHGKCEETIPYIRLRDKWAAAYDLGAGLERGEIGSAKVVFLSACYSMRKMGEEDPYSFTYVLSDHGGARYVIGYWGEIRTELAYSFSDKFYKRHFDKYGGSLYLVPAAVDEAKEETLIEIDIRIHAIIGALVLTVILTWWCPTASAAFLAAVIILNLIYWALIRPSVLEPQMRTIMLYERPSARGGGARCQN